MKKEEYAKDVLTNYKERSNEYKKKPRKTKINTDKGVDNASLRAYAKKMRIDKGMTQTEFAHSIGISMRCYQDYEEGRSNILNSFTRKMITALGLHIIDEQGNKYI